MFAVTNAALERLSRKLDRKSAAEEDTLRFRRAEGQWQLRVDRARPDDATFSHEGRNVLVMDKAASQAMTTMTLDVKLTNAGPRLKLRNRKD